MLRKIIVPLLVVVGAVSGNLIQSEEVRELQVRAPEPLSVQMVPPPLDARAPRKPKTYTTPDAPTWVLIGIGLSTLGLIGRFRPQQHEN